MRQTIIAMIRGMTTNQKGVEGILAVLGGLAAHAEMYFDVKVLPMPIFVSPAHPGGVGGGVGGGTFPAVCSVPYTFYRLFYRDDIRL